MRKKNNLICLPALLLIASSLAAPQTNKSYALLFGTIYGPDDRPVYGVKITIRPADRNKPKWELISNHNGEFAQRLPVGPGDYVVTADFKRSKTFPYGPAPEMKVHFEKEERQDISLHLTR